MIDYLIILSEQLLRTVEHNLTVLYGRQNDCNCGPIVHSIGNMKKKNFAFMNAFIYFHTLQDTLTRMHALYALYLN